MVAFLNTCASLLSFPTRAWNSTCPRSCTAHRAAPIRAKGHFADVSALRCSSGTREQCLVRARGQPIHGSYQGRYLLQHRVHVGRKFRFCPRGLSGRASTITESSLLQPGWRESHRSVNGVKLHVVEAGPEDGPLLILLHGFPEFWWGWRHQIGPFAEAGYHVVAPDMRGYNTSEIPTEVSDYVLDTLTADVVALADSFGGARFNLVAHDWGAIIAWWVAAQHPERIERAVIMDGPHPDVWGEQLLKHPTQALRSTYVAVYQLPWLPEAAQGAWDFAALRKFIVGSGREDTFEPGALDRYVEAWSHPGSLTGMINYYRALRERKTGKEPARIAPPVLVLWAEQDSFLERHVAEAGMALCKQGRLEIVAGTTHWLHLEEPERINATVLRFLAAEGTM